MRVADKSMQQYCLIAVTENTSWNEWLRRVADTVRSS